MVAFKNPKPVDFAPEADAPADARIREVAPDHDHPPVASPARELQEALHQSSFHSQEDRGRTRSNAMLLLTLVCVYAMAMLMMLGTLSA